MFDHAATSGIGRRRHGMRRLRRVAPAAALAAMSVPARLVGKYNGCLRGAQQMRLQLVPFRGAIANALYLRHYPSFPADRLRPSPANAGSVLSGDAETLMSDFARCVVLTDPVAVDTLLRSRPASDAEHDALSALSVHFPGCLFRGQNVSANPLGLRSVLAEAAYRQSIGAVPGAVAQR